MDLWEGVFICFGWDLRWAVICFGYIWWDVVIVPFSDLGVVLFGFVWIVGFWFKCFACCFVVI